MRTTLIGVMLLAATAASVSLYATQRTTGSQPSTGEPAARSIEVVFVLDTTSSMSGLIETAKQKIWSIASTMAQAEQAPEIRMGLVAFRDRGDDYVTRVVDLSADLDGMYAELMQLVAAGGGDAPESVNTALADALERISWSRDQSTYRVMFLVGDAPPHMDYAGESAYPEIVRTAVANGIVVNTIQCGSVAGTVPHWRAIARLGQGRYMQVDQSGGAFALETPYDEEIAALAAELDATRLVYGSKTEREAAAARVAAATESRAGVSAATRARRGVFNATEAGETSLFGDRDLVADVESGRVELESLAPAALPEPFVELDRAERQARIEALAAEREALRERIDALADARAAFIERAAAGDSEAALSLDRQIYETVRAQGAAKGLSYEGGPDY